MLTDEMIDEWKETVDRTATFVSRDFPDVEREDLRQALWLFVIENYSHLRSPEESTKVLVKAATAEAWDQRKQHLQLTSQYSYRTSDVKKILESVFDYSQWDRIKVPDDARSEFNDVFMELAADVKLAFDKLSQPYQQILFRRYGLGESITEEREKKQLYRATTKLVDVLNFYRGQPVDKDICVGTRKVMNNATSKATIDRLTNE